MKRLYWTNPDVYEIEVEVKSIGDRRVTLDPIVFHPDEGGQPPDRGTIGEADVLNVEIIKGRIVHTLGKPLGNGRYVARVDRQHRLHTSRQRTAQHIISGIAERQIVKNRTQIRKPGQRVVFLDEGRLSPASWTIWYDQER